MTPVYLEEELKDLKPGLVTSALKTVTSPEFWKDRFPCSRWIPAYRMETLVGDIIAGTLM